MKEIVTVVVVIFIIFFELLVYTLMRAAAVADERIKNHKAENNIPPD